MAFGEVIVNSHAGRARPESGMDSAAASRWVRELTIKFYSNAESVASP
jgi:hypothetical protein